MRVFIAVTGFSLKKGGCMGNDMDNAKLSKDECALACQSRQKCAGFMYIFSGRIEKFHPCVLKTKMCVSPNKVAGLRLYSYYKMADRGKYVFVASYCSLIIKELVSFLHSCALNRNMSFCRLPC